MEISPSRTRLLWRLLIAGIVLTLLILMWVEFGRGHGSTGTSGRLVPSTYSANPWLTHGGPPRQVVLRPVSFGAPVLLGTMVDVRDVLRQDLSRPAYMSANP